jgi:PPE-repeat protein
MWMGSPPEVHSALLSAGAGPGPLLASAGAWSALGAEYAAVAEELMAVLGSVQAGVWQGPSAQAYVAAHVPYLAWLNQTGADSVAAAARCNAAAAAYTAALAAMPTLPELAANHAVHGVLLATNFFGINTIPIALNEADYFRMWVQAAATMAIYQEVCDGLVATTPRAVAAPTILTPGAAAGSSEPPSSQNPLQGLLDFLEPILKSLGIQDGVTAHDPMISNALTTAVSDFLQNFGINWNPAAGTLNGQVYDYYSNAAQPIWYLARSLELFEDFLNVAQNPSQIIPALQYIAALALFDWPTHIAQLATTISQSPALIAAAAGAVAAPVAGLGGLGGLAGLAQPLPGADAVPVGPATPATVAAVPAAAVGPAVATAPPPPAPPPTTTPGGAAPAAPAAAPPAAPAGVPLFPYLIGGGPGIDFGSGLGAHAVTAESAKKKAPTPEAVSAATAAESRRSKRLRRRRTRPGHDDAVMDMTVEVSPDWEPTPVSDRGAGELGRPGGAPAGTPRATGLTGLAGAELTDGPRLPLLPRGWAAG